MRRAALILALLVALVYSDAFVGPAERTGFAWVDDATQFTENPFYGQPWDADGLAHLSTRAYNYDWNPVYWPILWTQGRVFGNDARVYRAFSVLIFWLSLLTLLGLLRVWPIDPRLSFGLVALLAVHPLMIESVTWPTTQKTLWSLLLALLALHHLERMSTDGPIYTRRWWFTGLLILLAMGIKLRGLALPFGLFAYDLLRPHEAAVRTHLRRASLRCGPWMLLALLWMLFNQWVIFGPNPIRAHYDAYLGGTLASSLASHAVIEWNSLGHWFTTQSLNYFHIYDVRAFTDPSVWVALLGISAVGAVLIVATPKPLRWLCVFGLLWYALQRGLTAGVLPFQWGVMHNRYLTVAAPGLLIAAACALQRVVPRLTERRAGIPIACAGMVLTLSLGAYSHLNTSWLLMDTGRAQIAHPDNVRTQYARLMAAQGTDLDRAWAGMQADPRAGATLGRARLARAHARVLLDRQTRNATVNAVPFLEACDALIAPYGDFIAARYLAEAGDPGAARQRLKTALTAERFQPWQNASREPETLYAQYIRIGDATARLDELRLLDAALAALYPQVKDADDRAWLARLGSIAAPDAAVWLRRATK